MQDTVDQWAGILRASGGTLEPNKSFWYLLEQYWTGSEWKYCPISTTASLTVTNEKGVRKKLTQLEAMEARETLGIYSAMGGDSRAQRDKLKKITKTVAAKFWKATVTPSEMWEIFMTTLCKTWDYPKIAVSLTAADWEEICKLVIPTVLNKSGVSSKFPWVLLYAPIKYHGMGLKNPFIDQMIQQVICYANEVQPARLLEN